MSPCQSRFLDEPFDVMAGYKGKRYERSSGVLLLLQHNGIVVDALGDINDKYL
jgi:hypothetical protein